MLPKLVNSYIVSTLLLFTVTYLHFATLGMMTLFGIKTKKALSGNGTHSAAGFQGSHSSVSPLH